MRVVRAYSKPMKQKKSGKIILSDQTSPIEGAPEGGSYAMARGAQNAFMKSVALELARYNVICNTLAVGYVDADYYPDDLKNSSRFEFLPKMNVPLARLAGSLMKLPNSLASYAVMIVSFLLVRRIPFSGGSVLVFSEFQRRNIR